MSYNSTIRQKMGSCPLCNHDRNQPLTKGLCQNHYWQGVRMKSVQKLQEQEITEDESLATVITDLDIVFSRYVRLKDSDLYGYNECYCCGKRENWKFQDCGHFIPRSHMYTRFSENNCKPCCQSCNRMKDGNLSAFARHLEQDNPGSVESLLEQGRLVYKYTIEELKQLISEYTHKLKQLKS